METLSYKIESFEGPMDLLLHLISKHKVRIEDVPIMDLINQYLDYMKKLKEENLEVASEFQLVAGKLAEQANGFNFFSREPQELEVDMTYTRLHEPSELYKAYMAAVGKGKRKLPPPVEAFSGIIARKIVSVSSRFSYILRKLGKNRKQKFISFFERSTSRSEMVATFMAMLALVKSKKVEINGDGNDAEVTLITNRR